MVVKKQRIRVKRKTIVFRTAESKIVSRIAVYVIAKPAGRVGGKIGCHADSWQLVVPTDSLNWSGCVES